MELTKSIMELQKNANNHTENHEEIPQASNQQLLALASISPLLGPIWNPISETCKSQSMHYLSELFSNQPWAKKSKRCNQPHNHSHSSITLSLAISFQCLILMENGPMEWWPTSSTNALRKVTLTSQNVPRILMCWIILLGINFPWAALKLV